MSEASTANSTRQRVAAGMAKRRRGERVFRALGLSAILFGALAVGLLLGDIARKGVGAFVAVEMKLNLKYDRKLLDIEDEEEIELGDFRAILRRSVSEMFPEEKDSPDEAMRLLSDAVELDLAERLMKNPQLIDAAETRWVRASSLIKQWRREDSDGHRQVARVRRLEESGRLRFVFNKTFFTATDSRNPESAGILGALIGSMWAMLFCMLLSFPIGIAAAVYLEEFAPRGRWVDWLEININNLAAVPSIIFGLLGLAVFINVMGMPRSAPLVGGLTLTLMTLPTVIIASRAAIQAVPPSVREGALAMGMSHTQMVIGHVLPMAMPGMLTGGIIGMAQALGETAPLLMIGMVAFVSETASGPLSPATALPVQIYLWADSPERAFVELTAGGILVLLLFLFSLNAFATVLRRMLENRKY